jgi:hypothetical protein
MIEWIYIGYMNVALEQTEEWVDGVMKAKYGDAFIRGNNILYIRLVGRQAGRQAAGAGLAPHEME